MKQINRAILSQFVSGLTAVSFVLGSVIPVQAQTSGNADPSAATGAGQVINGLSNIVSNMAMTPAVFTQSPQQLQINWKQQQINSQMKQCELKGSLAGVTTKTGVNLGEAADLVSKYKDRLTKKKSGEDTVTSGGCSDPSKVDACKTECKLTKNFKASCDRYSVDSEAVQKEGEELEKYIAYLRNKKECGSKDYETLKKQNEVLNCQMQVLQDAINFASQAVQQTLQNNGKQYSLMNQYMGELGDQMGQISALVGGVGPDGKEMPGKWTELQKSLYENFNEMTANEGKFKNDSNNLAEQTKQNEAYLEATKAQKFGSCMFGSAPGSVGVTCWRPKVTYAKDSSGNMSAIPELNKYKCPVYEKALCSPVQAARSAIELSFLTSNGQPYQDSTRCDEATVASRKFDSVMNDLSARLGTEVNSWHDMLNKYNLASQVNGLSSVNAVTIMSSGAQACMTSADNWKKNAQDPNKAKMDKEAQTYAEQKTKLDNKKNELSSSLDAALTGMNKAYADVMAALSDQAVSLNTVQCTKDNPATMQKCYADIRNNLKNLLQGNAAGTTTTKVIKGGTMTPGFAAPCNGLDGCITTYRTIRDKLNDQMRLANQAKQKFVQDGNSQIMTQLNGDGKTTTGFAQFLAGIQQDLMKQYDGMKSTMAAMGVNAPDTLKRMEAEMLEQMEGPNGEKGPYGQPKNLAAVLSGMVQPGGLIDFSDLGLRDALADAKEKADKKKEGLANLIEKLEDQSEKYGNMEKQCGDRVGNDAVACDRLQSMATENASSPLSGLFDAIQGFAAAGFLNQEGKVDTEAVKKQQKSLDEQLAKASGLDRKQYALVMKCKTQTVNQKVRDFRDAQKAAAQRTVGAYDRN